MAMTNDDRAVCERIFRASLGAVDPERVVAGWLDRVDEHLRDTDIERLVVVGFGKAAVPMLRAVDTRFGERIAEGVVVTKYEHAGDLGAIGNVPLLEAAHPVPDAASRRGAEEIARVLARCGSDTLIVCLVSGGGSALLCAPAEPLTLEDKQETTSLLLRAGATIDELNAVRKHLSAVKGGRLAELAFPARLVTLIVSDVIGDPLHVIASGPTVPDPSTFTQALAVIESRELRHRVPSAVITRLEEGAAGRIPETPKESGHVFERVENWIVSRNADAVDAAETAAKQEGFHVETVGSEIGGEAREVALDLLKRARAVRGRPACLIAGGETTVTVRGEGRGGRNTEMALAAAMAIEEGEAVTFLSGGTDGTDGPTDAAGAVADGDTRRQAVELGVSAEDALADNDSYTFFDRVGGLMRTGPTGTNVMDLQIVIVR